MQALMIEIMNQFGYIGILLLIAVENIFPPIPSEVILTFGGFMTTYTSLKVWGVILSATLGSVLGALILYYFGRWLTPQKLQIFTESKLGRLLHFRRNDVSRAVGWFSRRGSSTIFFCRFIPVLRSLISIPAGIAQMDLVKFLILTTAGTLTWNTALVYLGVFAGASWEKIVRYMNGYSIIAIIAFCILAATAFKIYYEKRFSKK